MTPRTRTAVVTSAALAGLGLYDLWTYLAHGNASTISRTILDWSCSSEWGLILPFAVGVLVGHFFWPQHVVIRSSTADKQEGR